MRRQICWLVGCILTAIIYGCAGSESEIEAADKPIYVQPIPKDTGATTASSTDALVNVVAYHWKSHTVLDEVAVVLEDSTGNQSSEKGFTSRILPVGSYQVSVSPPDSSNSREAAIDLKDALATLKLAIGIESINGTDTSGKSVEVSAYQRAAADFNSDGRIDLKDALEILKYSIGVPVSSSARWQYFHDTEVIGAGSPPKVELAGTKRDVPINGTTSVGVAALLTGDVDGSWRPSQTTPQVDPTYYTNLVSALRVTDKSVTLDRWGVADTGTANNKIVVSRTYQDGIETITYSDGSQVKSGSNSVSISFSIDGLFKYLTYLFSDNSENRTTTQTEFFQEITGAFDNSVDLFTAVSIEAQKIGLPGINSTSILSAAIAVDLNGDDRKELILAFSTMQQQNGLKVVDPVYTKIFIYELGISNKFKDQTEKYLEGSQILRAASGASLIKDFNGDGLPDIMFATNQEDGRNDALGSLMTSQPTVLLSRPGGRHYIKNFGIAAWNLGYPRAMKESSGEEIYIINQGGSGIRSYKFQNGYFVPSEIDMSQVGTGVFSFFEARNTGEKLVVTNGRFPRIYDANLYIIDSGNQISMIDSVASPFKIIGSMIFTTWQGSSSTVDIISDGVNKFVGPGSGYGVSDSCLIRIFPTSEVSVMMIADMLRFVDYQPGQINYTAENWKVPYFFNVSGGRLTESQIQISGWHNAFNSHELRCFDVNSDGYDDIVINELRDGTSGTFPLVFLNNKSGGFKKVNDSLYPRFTTNAEQDNLSVLLADFDGDGVIDYISLPEKSVDGSAQGTIRFFKGVRNLN